MRRYYRFYTLNLMKLEEKKLNTKLIEQLNYRTKTTREAKAQENLDFFYIQYSIFIQFYNDHHSLALFDQI